MSKCQCFSRNYNEKSNQTSEKVNIHLQNIITAKLVFTSEYVNSKSKKAGPSLQENLVEMRKCYTIVKSILHFKIWL